MFRKLSLAPTKITTLKNNTSDFLQASIENVSDLQHPSTATKMEIFTLHSLCRKITSGTCLIFGEEISICTAVDGCCRSGTFLILNCRKPDVLFSVVLIFVRAKFNLLGRIWLTVMLFYLLFILQLKLVKLNTITRVSQKIE